MNKTDMNKFTNIALGFILIALSLLFAKNCSAQDYIITTANDTIKCFIQNNDGANVIYKYKPDEDVCSSLNLRHIKEIVYSKNKLDYSYAPKPYNHHFCEIICIYDNDKSTTWLNIGEKIDIYRIPKTFYDDSGEIKKFSNLIDAINLLDLNGYKPESNFIIIRNGKTEYHCIMYKIL